MLAAATGAAAQVTGKLVLGAYKPNTPTPKHPAYNWELENGFKEVRGDKVDARREIAVVLTGEGTPSNMDRLEITFSGGGLMPSTVVVRTGATLLVRNDDEFAHELYADGMEGFSAEAISPRGRRSVAVKSSGSFVLHDKLIPHVSGQLVALPDLVAIGTIEADGQYSFKDVPPGKYVLKVLHGAKELGTQPVEVGARPLTVNPITLSSNTDTK